MSYKSITLAAIAAATQAIKSSTNLQKVSAISAAPGVDSRLSTLDIHETVAPQQAAPKANDLGQTSAGDYCQAAHDRIRNAHDHFYRVQGGSKEFVDGDWPRTEMITNPRHPHNRTSANLSEWETKAVWADSIDIRYDEEDGYGLWGSEGIDPNDIYQGQLGNCWFMHAAAAVAERPHRLERIFLNTQLSNNGIYGCQMYPLGVPATVTIDDVVPLDDAGNSPFAGVSRDKALWGVLIEKCFAKLNGNYEAIVSGDPGNSIRVLSGAPSQRYSHAGLSADELFNKIREADGTHAMISAATAGESDD